ncbi:MAG: host attachment protein [Aquabacterium sp.]|jgi:protein required for attachment to host cells|nr:MAG: host attachment protein [Aquabacterium sp.]
MQQELIVIANAGEARFFKRHTPMDPLLPGVHLEHPQSRQKSSELAAQPAGHGSSDRHSGGVSFAPHQSPHEKEGAHFAREVAGQIDKDLAADGGRSLVLFCSAPFLGELRTRLSASAHERLRAAFDVDLTSYGLDEIEQRVEHHLHPTPQPQAGRR